MITREELKNNLPRGSAKKIAKKAGVSQLTVYRFLDGSIKNSPVIEKAALEMALEYVGDLSSLRKQFSQAIAI